MKVTLFLASCAMDHGDADSPPAAPTGLEASEVAGGAHLTWTDNSDNEDRFTVMRSPRRTRSRSPRRSHGVATGLRAADGVPVC